MYKNNSSVIIINGCLNLGRLIHKLLIKTTNYNAQKRLESK